jgi:methylenetetrahydrofolate reductase (NADPH)
MLNPQAAPATAGAADAGLVQAIVQLARDASIEINVHDVMHVEPSRALLPSGTKVYVSHLPKQTWQETEAACRVLRAAGFLPVPHLPVRLVADEATLDGILDALAAGARVEEILLVAGDYPAPAGPYSMVADVLSTGALERHGLKTISMAGHPEGHPKVSLDEIRSAEVEKVMLATQAGLDVSLVTQFFFEHTPFLEWVGDLRARDVRARFVAGVAGPARPATLLKFALRCGVGASIRALTARPSSFMHLLGDHGPEQLIRGLAEARSTGAVMFGGIHVFCFGGYLRTCEWLHRVANGKFRLNSHGSFDVGVGYAA